MFKKKAGLKTGQMIAGIYREKILFAAAQLRNNLRYFIL